LNAVSEHFLGDVKVDMPIPEMFDRYEKGTSEDMQAIGLYCVKDTELPLRLMNKLNNIPNLVEMAKATCVPMNYLIERGQQIKVFSQIAKQTRLDDMLVITMHDGKTSESFVGATVLNAKTGAYMDKVVTGLDFASLYPTIMRAHNLCYNTIVLNDKYDNLPGVKYETVQWTSGEKDHMYKFAQNTQGILPKLLENLAKNRKQAKKDMANAKDAFMKSVYNSKQLAFKVSMNSIYGFCAAFMLPCQPISASVTTIGRNMIEHTKNLVEEWYPGSEVIYGDSVRGDTPVLVRRSDGPQFVRIDNLFLESAVTKKGLHNAKEYVVPDKDLYVWSDGGFTKIKHVMRHKTTKRMYRILTHTGLVDVTEDHSLLLENGQAIKPGEVTVGTRLLHREPNVERIQSTFESDSEKLDIDCTNKMEMAKTVLEMQQKGYNVTIDTLTWTDVFHITCTKTSQRKDPMAIKKIHNLGYTNEYVYDIETENHHFHVGPGNLVVHNTDSVMVIFNTKDATGQAMLEESFRLGEEAADRISQTFKRPIELEFEKCYFPYLLFSKKRYAGLMYTNTQKPDYIDAKGIQLVRRDNASFVREISKKVLDMIMYDRAVIEAAMLVQDEAKKLLNYEVPVDQLIVSKSLRKDYKNDKQPHLYVAKKINERNPGSGPKCGERVPYVFMDTGNPKHLQFEKAEDPTYVIENGLQNKIDVMYYLKHSLISPVESLFELFMTDAKEDIFGELIRDFEKQKAKQSSITSFFGGTPSKSKLQTNTEKSAKRSIKKPVKKPTGQRQITLFM
jgi:DNA polymerase elongation subunit (family B)